MAAPQPAVGPGDRLSELPASGQVRVGAGIQPADSYLVATKAGLLRQTRTGKLWIEGQNRRYTPAVDDAVVGMITERYGESWTVDILGPFPAVLPALAFEGVTKRNRPRLEPGDLVYARVTAAPRDAETEITCVLATGKSGGFGALSGGMLLDYGCALARKLLVSPPCPMLAALGAAVQFELAVGQNGRVWVSAATATLTVAVASALQQADLPAAEANSHVKGMLESRP